MVDEELNSKQQSVVKNLTSNILLLAAAGTGKTNTLACRIGEIIASQKAEASEILCLTFTNKACREMQARITNKVGNIADKVMVKTIHGFCYEVIRNEAKHNTDVPVNFTVFDEIDSQGVIQELIDEQWSEKALYNLISKLKEKRGEYHYFSADELNDYQLTLQRCLAETPQIMKKLAVDNNNNYHKQLLLKWQQCGAKLTCDYNKKMLELHGLDYTDLLLETQRLFNNPVIRLAWSRRFLYINIDEVQDTSELEYDILSKIFGAAKLLLCGDYFQTIYEWRGSQPAKIFAKYIADYQPEKVILQENYRATKLLLNASFACLKQLFPQQVTNVYPSGWQAHSKLAGDKILLKSALDIQEEAQWIYETVARLPVEDYSRVCVLTRNNSKNKQLADQLRRIGMRFGNKRLPFMAIDDAKFYRRQEIKDALAFLRLVINKHDVNSLVRILPRFAPGIGMQTVKKIFSAEYAKVGVSIVDYIDNQARSDLDTYACLQQALDEENIVVFDVESTGVDTTSDEIIQIAGIRLTKTGAVKEKFVRVLVPTKSVGDSEKVHKMSDDWLKANGEAAATVLRDFCKFAAGAVMVGHNVSYDLTILASQLKRLKLPPLDYVTYYDTLDIFRRFYPQLANHKLETLGKFCQTEHRSSHDALDDILATADILMYAIEKAILPTKVKRRELMAKWLKAFAPLNDIITNLRTQLNHLRPHDLLAKIVVAGGIKEYYQNHREDTRIDNLRELFVQAKYMDDLSLPPLDAIIRFLNYTALSNTELDRMVKQQQIPIITVHQAKGAEFDYVFVAGLEEGTFPNRRAISDGVLDEEARLFYVAITRAKLQLFLSWSQQMSRRYSMQYNLMSRFLNAIPREYISNV